ncbi:MAG TPA: CHAT domain-containing protein, partial [Thermoanaerobaculia bacterium]|nr:CHAT domain-containing protein [Thermoanaerobaculia bacterium]
ACQTGRAGFSWTRPGGWGQKLTELGAGAFLGTYWSVRDGKAQTFAEAFYRHFLAGVPIAEAVRWARLELAKRFPGDPTRLAYVLFAHPLAACTENPIGLPDPARELLRTEVKPWDPEVSSPAALLRAEYGIVPFHGREKVQQELEAWAQQDSRLSVRLFTGPGGMGKTRLALETALALQKEGWQAGFVLETSPLSPEELWTKVARPEGRLLLVIDYAETRRPFLVPLLRLLLQVQAGPVRVMLLARAALDWWDQLKSEGDGVGELLAGPATQRIPLRPVAQTLEDRRKSYHLAGRAFAEKLLREPPAHEPANLESPYFERVLLLHMAALGAVDGVNVKDEDGVLDHILARERRYWDRRAKTRSIPDLVVEGIGRSLGAITLRGGVATQTEATEFIGQLAFFQGQDAATVHAVASLLHEVYSTKQRWIEPLQPDLLGEHLVMRELERGADELLTLTLGPAETAPSKDASASAE